MYSVIDKRVLTPLRDLPAQIIETVDHFPTQQRHLDLQKRLGILVNQYALVEFEKKINSLFFSGWKFSQRCENTLVNYGIHYRKLCDLMT